MSTQGKRVMTTEGSGQLHGFVDDGLADVLILSEASSPEQDREIPSA